MAISGANSSEASLSRKVVIPAPRHEWLPIFAETPALAARRRPAGDREVSESDGGGDEVQERPKRCGDEPKRDK